MKDYSEHLARITTHEESAERSTDEASERLGQIGRWVDAVAVDEFTRELIEKDPKLAEMTGVSLDDLNKAITMSRASIITGIEEAIANKKQALAHSHAADQVRTALMRRDDT